MTQSTSAASTATRLHSLDQFRGYCVLGMLLVNFLAGLEVTPAVLEHHNTYFSYADSILPAFLFAVGFAYRLTWCKRMERQNRRATIASYLRRGGSLVVVSLILSGIGGGFVDWSAVNAHSWAQLLARLVKADLWEVLAIIGVTQVCLLPLVGRSTAARAGAMLLALIVHVGLSYAFNFAFVLGQPNAVDELLGTTGQRCWDGGLFGLINWSFVMLAGTVAYDLVRRGIRRSSRGLAAHVGCHLLCGGIRSELHRTTVRRCAGDGCIATLCRLTRLASLVSTGGSIPARPVGRAAIRAGARDAAVELLADEQAARQRRRLLCSPPASPSRSLRHSCGSAMAGHGNRASCGRLGKTPCWPMRSIT